MSRRNDFEKFYMSQYPGRVSNLDSVMGRQQKIVDHFNPYILEERQLNVTQMDVFSRLMMDRIIFMGDEVCSDTMNVLVSQLLYLEQAEPGKGINLYINTPGGEVISGLAAVDVMNYITSPVATTCVGMAASMGSILLVSGEKGQRSILPHGRVLIHQPLGGCKGQASDMEIEVKEILKMKEELYQILSKGSGQTMEKIYKDADRDFWLTADEALKYGLVDQIITKK